jgi:2,4-dienoyl-CoA reductase-like NADH-dependent reductase (Old Yellow Enzyme family)
MSHLFSPLKLRDLTLKNRIFVSPMCQYSSTDGLPNDWHLVHLGSRAVGGAGLVMVEASAVSPEGRISPHDAGIWSDAHAAAFARITAFLKEHGAAPAIQLAHAGRKASTHRPWSGRGYVSPADGGWLPLGPSPIPFDRHSPTPREMSPRDIDKVIHDFTAAARRALAAGFEVIELHAAHGYLAHEFLSPLSNRRTDLFGGGLENRMRLPLQLARTLRDAWPAHLPVFVRISATDYAENGWDLAQSVIFCQQLKSLGIDLIDTSSGGNIAGATIPVGPGYQVPFAQTIRREAHIPTAAVGLITTPQQAESILAEEKADAVLLAREMLRDPYWPLHAAQELGADVKWPVQYERAKPSVP